MQINAVIFDLDGTLIETEKLKAQAYAKAAIELCPDQLSEGEVLEAYADFVGESREELASGLMKRFNLEEPARQRMEEFAASQPWQVFTRLRLEILEEMLKDEEFLRSYQRVEPVSFLQTVRSWGCKVGLATMSRCQQVMRTLNVLALEDAFDFIATIEDVTNPKPDPEIYLLVSKALGVPPEECMVLEDSLAGVRAGLAAGAMVVAIATPLTRQKLYAAEDVSPDHIIDDPDQLEAAVDRLMAKHNA